MHINALLSQIESLFYKIITSVEQHKASFNAKEDAQCNVLREEEHNFLFY